MQKQPIMIVMELVPGGSLLTYLRNSGPTLNPKCLLGKRFIILPTQDLQIGDHQKNLIFLAKVVFCYSFIYFKLFSIKFKLIHFSNSNFIFSHQFLIHSFILLFDICLLTVFTRKQPALEFNPHSNVIRNF